MPSLHSLEARMRALEARLAEVEGGYGDTLYKLHRHAVRTDLQVGRVIDHLGLEPVTEEEVDRAIEEDQ